MISISYAFGSEKGLEEILTLAKERGIPLTKTNRRQLSNVTKGANHQGVIAEVGPPKIFDLKTFIKRVTTGNDKPVVVVLDSIMDPHNFGAILRSAETFGVAGAIFPKDRSADINTTVVKTSAGATEYLDFCRVTNIARSLSELRKNGFHVIAAESDGEIEVSKFNPLLPLAIVFGSEGKGVRPLVRKNCDEAVRIPISGNVESLNVSAAAAVIFYEITKKIENT